MRKHISMILLIAALAALVVAGCVAPGGSDTSGGGGIGWVKNDLNQGLERARSEHKKIFLYFGAGY